MSALLVTAASVTLFPLVVLAAPLLLERLERRLLDTPRRRRQHLL